MIVYLFNLFASSAPVNAAGAPAIYARLRAQVSVEFGVWSVELRSVLSIMKH